MQRYFLIALADRHQWGPIIRLLLSIGLLIATVLMLIAGLAVIYGLIRLATIAW